MTIKAIGRPSRFARTVRSCEAAFVLAVIGAAAHAQFKETGPAPFPPAVAQKKIRKALETVTAENRQQTVAMLSGLLPWYRDMLDDELIAAWKRNTRANVTEAIEALADAHVASGVIEYAWREQRQATFTLAYAPMLGHLMARYPQSAEPFLADLRGEGPTGQPPALSPQEAEAVCRILVDMPDIGSWKKDALQILPRYPEAARKLLTEDEHGPDPEKTYSAHVWLLDLKMEAPANAAAQPAPRRTPPPVPHTVTESGPVNSQPTSVAPPRRVAVNGPPIPVENHPQPSHAALPTSPAPVSSLPYAGATSGTFESSGSPIPQNAEYVFRNVPPVKLRLDFDTRIWEARLVPGEGQTQKLLVKNKSSGPQKRCVVHWTVAP
jgi:hypothetical protein